MANFIEEFMNSYGSETSKQISSNLNLNQNTVQQIIPQLAPLILGGLKRQKENFGGQERVDHILNKYGSDSVLDDIAGLISNKAHDSRPDPKLGGLLGDSGVQAANMVSKNFGIDGSTAAKLIPMIAPLLLGALTQKRDKGGAGSSGIASLLDADGDGSILDDVAGFMMKGLGSGGSQKSGGLLGGLLGSLLKKR